MRLPGGSYGEGMNQPLASLARYTSILVGVAIIAIFLGGILIGSNLTSYGGGVWVTLGSVLASIGGLFLLVGMISHAVSLAAQGIAEAVHPTTSDADPSPSDGA